MPSRLFGAWRLDRRPETAPRLREFVAKALGTKSPGLAVCDSPDLVLWLAPEGTSASRRDGALVACAGRLAPEQAGDGQRTAAEIFLRRHAALGRDAARGAGGHFVAVVCEEAAGRLRLFQDGFPGLQTLYTAEQGGCLLFSDRMGPLLRAAPGLAGALDDAALYQYLARSYISAPRTIFAGIRQVEGGEVVEAADGKVARHDHSPWRFPAGRLDDEAVALERYEAALREAVHGFQADGPAVFLLSGGLDSSLNVALGSEHETAPLTTLCTGAPRYTSDAQFAREVASRYGTRHQEHLFDGSEVEALPQIVWEMENPYFEPGVMLSWVTLANAARHAGAVVGADLCDQIFGSCIDLALRRHAARQRFAGRGEDVRRLVRLVCQGERGRGVVLLEKVYARLLGSTDLNNWCGVYGLMRSRLLRLLRRPLPFSGPFDDGGGPEGGLEALLEFGCTGPNRDYALNALLIKTGRLADRFGLAYRTPFADRRVFDLVLSLAHPLRNRVHEGPPRQFVRKYLHRQLARRLLGPGIVDRPKQGGAISPRVHFEDPGRAALIRRAVLESEPLNALCRPSALAALFAGPRPNATHILMLLALDLWWRVVADRPGAGPPAATLTECCRDPRAKLS